MDISNGEGVGVALFVQGCHFHCKNCFNQETWGFDGGTEWTKEIEDKFISLADKEYITRISILGGEPLASENIISVLKLVNLIRKRFKDTKEIWLFTGYEWEDIFVDNKIVLDGTCDLAKFKINTDCETRKRIIRNCDVVIDGRFVDELKDPSLRFRGSSNQRLIDVKKSIESGEIVLWQ